jgi:hypothetical protein
VRINTLVVRKSLLMIAVIGVFCYVGFYERNSLISTETNIQEAIESTGAYRHDEETHASDKYYGARRAAIALGEYKKGVKEDTRGCNCGIEVNKYTNGKNEQWCTMFVSWVTKQAGLPLTTDNNPSWSIVKSRDLAAYLENNGIWYSSDYVIENNLKPQLGDFVIYWRGDFENNLGHVDIVVKEEDGLGRLGLVGGNVRDRVSYRELNYKDDYGFLGFGRP